jgi:hypothetical protein
MAGARGSANGSGVSGDGAGTGGRAGGRPRSGGRAQAHAQPPSGARTLTIGEAAARLSGEFPGLTVAALRRLEAAGKFTAGRSSAGYRRYSEADLDLIRLVLSDPPGAVSGPGTAADPADLSGAESPLAHPAVYAPGTALAHATAIAAQRPAAARTGARAVRMPSSRVPASRAAGTSRTQPSAIAALFDLGAAVSGQHPDGRPEERPDPAPGSRAAARGLDRTAAVGTVATATPAVGSAPSPSPSPALSPAARRAERRWPDAEFFTPDLGEVALDRDQLAAAARTDRAWIDGLVEYGVLPAAESAGGADLLVARASAELAQFGVEPRHLRAVAASAARVAELITAATSTGTGRDPARRERAVLAAPGRGAEAAAAAVRLHAALVRAALLRG